MANLREREEERKARQARDKEEFESAVHTAFRPKESAWKLKNSASPPRSSGWQNMKQKSLDESVENSIGEPEMAAHAQVRKTTGQLRSIMFDALKRAAAGEISRADGQNMVEMTNSITKNLTAETKAIELQIKMNSSAEGIARIGDFVIAD